MLTCVDVAVVVVVKRNFVSIKIPAKAQNRYRSLVCA